MDSSHLKNDNWQKDAKSHIGKETQIKAIIRYTISSSRLTKIKTVDNFCSY